MCCNNAKMHQLTGFTPDYSIDEGLNLTIDWFTKIENLNKYKVGIYNV